MFSIKGRLPWLKLRDSLKHILICERDFTQVTGFDRGRNKRTKSVVSNRGGIISDDHAYLAAGNTYTGKKEVYYTRELSRLTTRMSRQLKLRFQPSPPKQQRIGPPEAREDERFPNSSLASLEGPGPSPCCSIDIIAFII